MVPTLAYMKLVETSQARRAEWHDDYTLPSLWRFYQPSKISHGSIGIFGVQRGCMEENYRLWMTFKTNIKIEVEGCVLDLILVLFNYMVSHT